MASTKTYLLSPKFYFKRDGPIALGNIIADPFRPDRVLTTVDTATLTSKYPKIETFTDFDQELRNSRGKDVSLSAWVEFVKCAKIGFSSETKRLDRYTMTSLDTEYFVGLPSAEEVIARVTASPVCETIKASGFASRRQPVYMVTGRKLAKGLSATQESARQTGVNATAGASALVLTGSLGIKGRAAAHDEKVERTEWKAGDELVFAYQLMKIEMKGWRGSKFEYDDFRHRSALLGSRDEDEDEEDEILDVEVEFSAATVLDLARATEEGAMTTLEPGGEDEKLLLVYTSYE